MTPPTPQEREREARERLVEAQLYDCGHAECQRVTDAERQQAEKRVDEYRAALVEEIVKGALWLSYVDTLTTQIAESEAARRYPAVPEGGERKPCSYCGDTRLIWSDNRQNSRRCPECRPTPTPDVFAYVVLNKNGRVAMFAERPCLLTVADARAKGIANDGRDWVAAMCALLNANTTDPYGPFRIMSLAAQDGGSDA